MTPETTWNPKFKNLSDRKGTTTESQCLTEGIVRAIFEICPPQNRWCVEVGAFDGITWSNTYSFIQDGWNSLQIEGERNSFIKLQETFKDTSVICHQAVIAPDRFGHSNELSKIFPKYDIPDNLDFFCLDIDSYDYEVWRNTKYMPNVICIECNSEETDFYIAYYDPSFSVKDLVFEGFNPKRYGGATVGLLNKLADHKGYDLVCVDKHDAVYIRRGFSDLLKV